MKPHIAITITMFGLLMGSTSTKASARDISAQELASFLDVSSWETKVTLPQNTYTIDVCPIEDGKIGEGLFEGQIDWAKDPDGQFAFLAGPTGADYRIMISSKKGGSLSVSRAMASFKATMKPPLPESVSEGVYILLVDMVDRNPDGPQDDPATYKRGFVLKVAKNNS